MKVHPAAELFPMMSEEAFQALRADIDANGQNEAVRVWNGMLLDGRNRLRACEELGIECVEEPFHGNEMAAIDMVISLNLHRRHLTASQRAAVAAGLIALYEEQTREEQRAAGRARAEGPRASNGQFSAILREASEAEYEGLRKSLVTLNEAAAKAAAATGASRRYTQQAKALAAADPTAFEAVKRGEITLSKATAKPDAEPASHRLIKRMCSEIRSMAAALSSDERASLRCQLQALLELLADA